MVKTLLQSNSLIAFVATRNLARAKSFYKDTLGLKLTDEDGFALVFDASGTMLRVTLVSEIALAPYTVLGWETTDIRQTASDLERAGIKLERFPGLTQDESGIWDAPGGGTRVAWFKDPDGNTLSISQHS